MYKICIATGTRADWGILHPLAKGLQMHDDVQLQILATNMHLLESYGHTVDEIIADGFEISATVNITDANNTSDNGRSRAIATGQATAGSAEAFDRLHPDAVVILGDRFEMLGVASAAAIMGIPVIHLHGGEISEGAVDDSIRHAITKLSSLHLTSTEPYRRRVIQLGEAPDRVINTGSLGVWNMLNQPRISRAELLEPLGLDHTRPFALATFHPATLDAADPGERCAAMLEAIDRFGNLNLIITYPNNDAGSAKIIRHITTYASVRPGRVALVKSLGMKRYMSAVHECELVIGNSSGAIIEVPAAGKPAVNIGIRQRGRMHSPLVIDTADDADAIAAGICRALDQQFVRDAAAAPNPYFKPDAPLIAIGAIMDFMASLPAGPKKFYDLP